MGSDVMPEWKFRGTLTELIQLLSTLPEEAQSTRVMVFREGSTTEHVSIQLWSENWDDNGPAVVIDCD